MGERSALSLCERLHTSSRFQLKFGATFRSFLPDIAQIRIVADRPPEISRVPDQTGWRVAA